jgi:hypothetical protein
VVDGGCEPLTEGTPSGRLVTAVARREFPMKRAVTGLLIAAALVAPAAASSAPPSPVVLTPHVLNFGNHPNGTTTVRTLTIHNRSSHSIIVASYGFSTLDFCPSLSECVWQIEALTTCPEFPGAIETGESCQVSFSLTPRPGGNAGETYSADINIQYYVDVVINGTLQTEYVARAFGRSR